jgi:hypothetical protein
MENEPEDLRPYIAQQLANDLLNKLSEKSSRVQDKYDYYNADNDVRDFGISIPKNMINSRPGVGWASRAINSLSDRVVFDGFANDSFSINTYWDGINARQVVNKAKHDAQIAGCAFVAISDDPDTTEDRKVLIPFTALEATGEINQNTGLLRYGLAVTSWGYPTDKRRKRIMGPKDFVVFTPEFTAVFKDRVLCDIYENPTKRCLLHVVTRRSSADRPLGKSRLTNTARRIIQEVARLKRREEIAEEFYSTPQRYMTGLAQGAKKDTTLDTQIGKWIAVTQDDDGNSPTIGQLQQMSIDGFEKAKKDKARDFCAETALTLRNLGYETGNPTSAESLASMSDDLLLEAQAAQAEIGEQIKQIAITLRMALDQNDIIPDGLKDIVPAWTPIFQVNIGAAGDAMFKLFDVMPELKGTVTAYQMLGIGIRDAERLAAIRAKMQNNAFMGNGGAQ